MPIMHIIIFLYHNITPMSVGGQKCIQPQTDRQINRQVDFIEPMWEIIENIISIIIFIRKSVIEMFYHVMQVNEN